MSIVPPDIEAVTDAARMLRGYAVVTPLLNSPLLDDAIGARALIKAEPLQRTGSFKFRGALNRMSHIPSEDRSKGVVAWSSGNHAQGVAAAARLLNMKATIVMPSDAPVTKIVGTRALGAEIVLYDRYRESRSEIGVRLAADSGATIVQPFDDPLVIAGQGTVALEAVAQAAALGLRPDIALIPCGGGGLISGCSLALTDHLPGIEIYAVEPKGYDDTTLSLATGRRATNDPQARSICDALLASTPGDITFEINRRLLAGGLVVDDNDTLAAMAVAYKHLKLVIEPGGAVALAAALKGKIDLRDRTVLIVASGGNGAPDQFAHALGSVDN